MKNASNISSLKQLSTILLGIVLAIVLGVGQVGDFNLQSAAPSQEQTSDNDEDTTEDVVIVQTVNAIASVVQLHITHVLYFISETIFSDSPKATMGYLEKPYIATYLATVFRQIISPNAP